MEGHFKRGHWEWLLKTLLSKPAKYHREYQLFCRWHPKEDYTERREHRREKVSAGVEVTDDGLKVRLDSLKGGM